MKALLLVAIVIASLTTQAQAYLSTGITARGVAGGIGILAGTIDISVGVKMPLIDLEAPTVFNLAVGRQFLLTHEDEDNYSVTPMIGYANRRYTVFDEKLNGRLYKEVNAFYSLELGKDSYLGRFYLKGLYCTKPYIEVGMRAFINR